MQRLAAELKDAAAIALPSITSQSKTPQQAQAEQTLSNLLNQSHEIVHKAARLSPSDPHIQINADLIDGHVTHAKKLFGLPDDVKRVAKVVAPVPAVVVIEDKTPKLDEMYEGE